MRRLTDRFRRLRATTGGQAARIGLPIVTLFLTLMASPATLFAQAPPPTPVVTLARGWFFEAFIVVVMMGLALFVVCRSSRRN